MLVIVWFYLAMNEDSNLQSTFAGQPAVIVDAFGKVRVASDKWYGTGTGVLSSN